MFEVESKIDTAFNTFMEQNQLDNIDSDEDVSESGAPTIVSLKKMKKSAALNFSMAERVRSSRSMASTKAIHNNTMPNNDESIKYKSPTIEKIDAPSPIGDKLLKEFEYRVEKSAILIQKNTRGYLARKHFFALKKISSIPLYFKEFIQEGEVDLFLF